MPHAHSSRPTVARPPHTHPTERKGQAGCGMSFKPMTFGAGGMGCQPVGVSAFQQSGAAAEAEAAKREATPRVREWVEQMLPEEERSVDLPGGKAAAGQATNVMVTQLVK